MLMMVCCYCVSNAPIHFDCLPLGVFGTVVYSIDGLLKTSFSVVAATGVISNVLPIDRETHPEVELVYIATDTDPDHPRFTSVPLIITMDDINDQTPGFLSIPSPCAFDVAEGVSIFHGNPVC